MQQKEQSEQKTPARNSHMKGTVTIASPKGNKPGDDLTFKDAIFYVR